MDRIDLILDLQYGSTGKGLLAGYLAGVSAPDTVITAWAPNAGHTFIDATGRKFVHTHVANGIVSPNIRRLLLGPGSLINPGQFLHEVQACADIIEERDIRIAIHPHAALVLGRHVAEEAGPMTKIGSTKKGVGAAMIQRIRRDPDDMNVAAYSDLLKQYVCTVDEYDALLREARHVMIEGAQGFGLSMYHGFYPYTTSRDVSTWQVLADCGVPASNVIGKATLRIYGTARTFPIRVANRFDTEGTMVGYSGPVYGDQDEISFEDIGQATELTTVTKLPRRIFTFSRKQIAAAIRHCAPEMVFLNFINYCRTERELSAIVDAIEGTGVRVAFVGTGPAVQNVHNVGSYAYSTTAERRSEILNVWRRECSSNR